MNFQRQESLPTYIHGIGQPIYGNWDTKVLVQLIPFPKEPKLIVFKLVFFHHMLRQHLWYFMVFPIMLENDGYVYQDEGIINGFVYSILSQEC